MDRPDTALRYAIARTDLSLGMLASLEQLPNLDHLGII